MIPRSASPRLPALVILWCEAHNIVHTQPCCSEKPARAPFYRAVVMQEVKHSVPCCERNVTSNSRYASLPVCLCLGKAWHRCMHMPYVGCLAF